MEGLTKDAPDRISELPDGVILDILSLLTIKEAAATSVLSTRWKYLWTCCPRLIFDNISDNVYSSAVKKRGTFVKMVNYVVDHYSKGLSLHEFCVRFFAPDRSSVSHIDKWINFAFSANPTKVELTFLAANRVYSFPSEVFCASKTGGPDSDLILAAESVPPSPHGCQNRFTSLRELLLVRAEVSDTVFEAILSKCPLLECLVIENDRRLCSPKCNIPQLKLKRLTICANFLEDLEVVVPNLILFNYWGPRANLSIRGAQSLARAVILSRDEQEDFLFGPLSAYASQLESLVLDTGSVLGRIAWNKVPSLRNLRTVSLLDDCVRTGCPALPSCHRAALCLLEAAPILQRLELHLRFSFYDYYEEGAIVLDELGKIYTSRHQNLKEIMLTGLHGSEDEMQFVMFIVDRATALKSVEVSTKPLEYVADAQGFYEPVVIHCQDHGPKVDFEQLRLKLPSNVCLKCLV